MSRNERADPGPQSPRVRRPLLVESLFRPADILKSRAAESLALHAIRGPIQSSRQRQQSSKSRMDVILQVTAMKP